MHRPWHPSSPLTSTPKCGEAAVLGPHYAIGDAHLGLSHLHRAVRLPAVPSRLGWHEGLGLRKRKAEGGSMTGASNKGETENVVHKCVLVILVCWHKQTLPNISSRLQGNSLTTPVQKLKCANGRTKLSQPPFHFQQTGNPLPTTSDVKEASEPKFFGAWPAAS